MTSLKARIAHLEKGSISGGPLLIYDNGDLEIARAEASGRLVIRVSPIDAAL